MKRYLRLLILAAAGILGGCGYQVGGMYRENIKTVAVPMFTRGKDVYRRGLEMRLTEAVAKRIQQDTPYKISTRDRSDTILTGTIENIRQQVMNTNPDTGEPRMLEITITVSFTWKDQRTREVLAEQPKLRVAGFYIPHSPVSEDFFQGSDDVINKLARRIVEHMEKEWSTG